MMSKSELVFLDANLGFVEKIVLTDGTVLENAKVLFNAPVPTAEQCEIIFNANLEIAKVLLGVANPNWSVQPNLMVDHSMFKEGEL